MDAGNIGMKIAAAGVLLGGGAIALTALSAKNQAAAAGSAPQQLQRRSALLRDRMLQDILSGPEEIFKRVDQAQTEALLDALDGLAALLVEASRSGSPALFAKALRHKRAGTTALDALLSSVRVRMPSRALEIVEDCEALRKAMADYSHNIQQASSLSLLENAIK